MGWVTIKGNHVLIGDASQKETARRAEKGPPQHHTHTGGKESSQTKSVGHRGVWETSPAAMIGEKTGQSGYSPRSAAQWRSAAGVRREDIKSFYAEQRKYLVKTSGAWSGQPKIRTSNAGRVGWSSGKNKRPFLIER